MTSEDKIRQLTELLDRQMGTPCEQIRHQQELEDQRAAVIEECARVADDYAQNSKNNSGRTTGAWIAEDIRALKDNKP